MAFAINNVPIKNPSTFKIERFPITTMERLASADMVGDLIAVKYKFYFTYEALTSAELDAIVETINNAPLFFNLQYVYNGVQKNAVVYAGSIPYELHRAGTNSATWVWKHVNFNLIQR